jgi:FAD:protein FMN transferase
MRAAVACGCVFVAAIAARADELPSFAGPAIGTTYRVTLARLPGGMASGEVHREVERVLERIDRAASTWRADGDAARFNAAKANEWVDVGADLVAILDAARAVHDRSDGAFDVTVMPLVRLWRSATPPDPAAIAAARDRVGMAFVETRSADGRFVARKTRDGVEIDLAGIAPGYAVDVIGARLVELGSDAHLVELGGEVRAWGRHPEGRPWRVRLTVANGKEPRAFDVEPGVALATSTIRPGGGAIDPRTGRRAEAIHGRATTVLAESAAEADAWAVAAIVLELEPDERGIVTVPAPRRVEPAEAAKPAEVVEPARP